MTLYETLGLPDGAGIEAVKVAYRNLAKECHPNNIENAGDPAKAERWAQIQEAHRVLTDEEHRAFYNATGDIPKPRVDVEAHMVLTKTIEYFLGAVMNNDPDHVDPLQLARRKAENDLMLLDNNKDIIMQQQNRLRRAQARLKVKPGVAENPLDAAMRGKILEGDDGIQQMEKQAAMVRRVIENLNNYDYEAMQRVMMMQTTTSNATNTWT